MGEYAQSHGRLECVKILERNLNVSRNLSQTRFIIPHQSRKEQNPVQNVLNDNYNQDKRDHITYNTSKLAQTFKQKSKEEFSAEYDKSQEREMFSLNSFNFSPRLKIEEVKYDTKPYVKPENFNDSFEPGKNFQKQQPFT